ncbi:MAG TPA: TRAP transporter small permease [Burkholderiaceae bacterium]|nr:TRAP transporter small permease [Burkholderiaceae bacterium]
MDAALARPVREPSRLERAFVALNQWLVIALMALMATLVFINVVSRYVFNHSIIWVEELTQYQMIWITYVGAGLALREGRHVAVDIVEGLLPPLWRRRVRLAIGVAILIFLVAVAVLGFQIAAFTWDQETPVLNIPTGVPYLGVPIGALVCALHLLLVLGDFADKRFEHADETDAHPE